VCGLAATLGFVPDEATQRAVLASLHHRGPDGSGTHVEVDVFVGHTRLAILDLSDAASQPMTSEGGQYVLAYNGELYNFEALRSEAAGKGWRFRGTGDTEALLALLVLEGATCLPRLRGMFAFVFWDRKRRRLLAARDHLGIKPLYYVHGRRTVVSSEIRTLALLHDGAIDPVAVEDFLLTGSVVGPRTIVAGVRALPPGHLVTFEDGQAREASFWRVPESSPEVRPRDEVVADLEELLGDSVRRQLRSDVPVGTFLSGGLDSSLITSYAAEHLGEGLSTFSVGFADGHPRWDESSDAQLVADRYRTLHHHVVVSASEFLPRMHELPRVIDQPSVDGINSYVVSEAAAPHVKVALSGQGGDELFGGYNIFPFARRLEALIARLPTPPRSAARAGDLALRLPARAQHSWYLRAVVGVLTRGDAGVIVQLANPLFSATEVGVSPRRRIGARADRDLVRSISEELLVGYLPHTLLRDMDAMSMAHSLEVRVPLVDHVLTEFALSIPSADKVRWGDSKSLLRELARKRLPTELLERPKRGFTFPLCDWLRRDACRAVLREALAPERVRDVGLVDPKLVAHELARLQRPYIGDLAWLRAQRVWALFVLHEWYEHWRSLRRRSAGTQLVARL
jgi:asparagine synthase (glutamine-hydrolysing)